MATRSREWWSYATVEQRRGLEAADFRRTAEAALFKAGVTDDDRELPDFLQEYMDAQRANPLAPKREALESRQLPQPTEPSLDEELAAPRGPDLSAPADPERDRRQAIAEAELAAPRGRAVPSQDEMLAQASERFAAAERTQATPAAEPEPEADRPVVVPPGSELLEREARRRSRAELTGVSQPSGPPGGIQAAGGRVGEAALGTLSEIVDGRSFLDARLRGLTLDRVGLDDIGLAEEDNPRIVNEVISAINPLNVAIAGGGMAAASTLRTAATKLGPKAARAVNLLAGAVEPFAARPGLAFGAEVGAETLALEGGAQAAERGAPAPVQFAAGLGALALGAGGIAGGRRALRGAGTQATEAALREAAPEAFQIGRRPFEDVIPRATLIEPSGAVARPGAAGGAPGIFDPSDPANVAGRARREAEFGPSGALRERIDFADQTNYQRNIEHAALGRQDVRRAALDDPMGVEIDAGRAGIDAGIEQNLRELRTRISPAEEIDLLRDMRISRTRELANAQTRFETASASVPQRPEAGAAMANARQRMFDLEAQLAEIDSRLSQLGPPPVPAFPLGGLRGGADIDPLPTPRVAGAADELPTPSALPDPNFPQGAAVPREAHIDIADPSPPPRAVEPPVAGEPPRSPPPGRGTLGGGDPPDEILRRIDETRTPGEQAPQTLLRRHEGALSTAEREARVIVDDGAKTLRALDIGQRSGVSQVPRDQDIRELDELFRALHGEAEPPARLQGVFDELRQLTDWEEAARIDFDPNMATVEDYFYRGWKPPEVLFADTGRAGRGGVGARPTFKKPRADATYAEMREAGFEPLFWNPYEQWRVSRMQGVRYREQMSLVEAMKKIELAVPDKGGIPPEGWRTPRIGPAFEGKPFAIDDPVSGDPRTLFTRRWVVPGDLADSLENIYGTPLRVGSRAQRIGQFIDKAVFLPKRAKLFGSFFQQMDFATRAGVGAWTGMVDNLLAGKPIAAVQSLARLPSTMVDILRANMSPQFREDLRRTMNSTDALLPDRPGVHFRGISDAGLSTVDVTILPRNLDQIVREVAEEAGIKGSVRAIGRRFGDVEGAMRAGLFEGVYPAAIMSDIRNNIAPMAVRMFPDLSDEAINGAIARVANIKYSTIPASQSVVQDRLIRETLRKVMFSFGESEGLLRQATQAIKGPFAPLWRKHWLGAYLFLITTANAIHFASTGEPLPAERYSPISKGGFGPLPFGYNTDFAAPDIPFTGRSGVRLTLDLVGQLDTAFRVLDPLNFITSRESVPVRAISNQLGGTDFFGRPIDTVGPEGIVSRTQQLLLDVAAPIGLGGGGLEIARSLIPGAEGVIPEGESRIGAAGGAIQTAGINVRAETTPQLLDRKAQEFATANGIEGVSGWGDLESFQQKQIEDADPELAQELELRRETSALRGSEGAQRGVLADEVREGYRVAQDADDVELGQGRIDHREWREREKFRNGQIRAAFDVVFRDLGDREPETLLERYGATIDAATDDSDQVDWDEVEVWRDGLTDPENAEIDRNLGLNSTDTQKERRRLVGELDTSDFFEIRDRAWTATKELESIAARLAKFDTWADYREAELERLEARVTNELGLTGADAADDAERRFNNASISKRYTRLVSREEDAWARTVSAELVEQARVWEYLGLNAAQRARQRRRQPTESSGNLPLTTIEGIRENLAVVP